MPIHVQSKGLFLMPIATQSDSESRAPVTLTMFHQKTSASHAGKVFWVSTYPDFVIKFGYRVVDLILNRDDARDLRDRLDHYLEECDRIEAES